MRCRTRSGGRAQRDTPKDLLDPQLRERGLDVVVGTDRNTSADDQDIVAEAAGDRIDGGAAIVRHHLDLRDLGTRTGGLGGNRVGVGVAHLTQP